MAQSSGPISQGTTTERQFTDAMWRDRFGDEAGVLGDMDGTSYALTLPGSGDVVSVGSATQASLATVAGFVHRIPSGAPDTITIPAASGISRTDIIALRYDPTYTGLPGPVRLVRIAGTSAAVPTYDSTPPGNEELPLFSITRAPGDTLASATTTRMFPRLAPTLELPSTGTLPSNSPLGTVVWLGSTQWRRVLSGGSPAWVKALQSSGSPGTAFTTSGGGDVLIPHGLSGTPTRSSITLAGAGNTAAQYGKLSLGPVTSTYLVARLNDSRDGATLSGFGLEIAWTADIL